MDAPLALWAAFAGALPLRRATNVVDASFFGFTAAVYASTRHRATLATDTHLSIGAANVSAHAVVVTAISVQTCFVFSKAAHCIGTAKCRDSVRW